MLIPLFLFSFVTCLRSNWYGSIIRNCVSEIYAYDFNLLLEQIKIEAFVAVDN